MKVFVSSVIGGMEDFRAAVVDAVTSLGHEAVVAEEFAANPGSPRVACLSALRDTNLVILLLGEKYGTPQASSLSPTHEEYREAKGRQPVLVFVQSGVVAEAAQSAFIVEVEGWEGGHFRRSFSSPDELRREVLQALHRWELSAAVAPVDSAEMLARARSNIGSEDGGMSRRSGQLIVEIAIVGGPSQQILRPAEIENPALARSILQNALFGDVPIFTTEQGCEPELVGERLVLAQENGNSISIDESGAVTVTLPAGSSERTYGVVIEEDVFEQIKTAISFSAWLLEKIDPAQKLSRVVVVARISGSDYFAWRTREEHERSPNTVTYGHSFGSRDNQLVHLQPPDRARAALSFEADRMAEDLVTLLRRQRSG